ncbi:MAG: adenylate/guanylate cyclase domain-containing protein [Nitrosopumilus sp.]|nr:adenylate/guanylate cyclase domain-containing protein [Nitrosopumilus sp.]
MEEDKDNDKANEKSIHNSVGSKVEEKMHTMKDNNQDDGTEGKVIERMMNRDGNISSHNEGDRIISRSSIGNKEVFDLQTLLTQRQDRLWNVLQERYKYNTSIKRGQNFLLNHVDSKLSLIVMYADLVGSTKMSRNLPVEKMAKIIKVFSHELSSVVESYDGFVLKYVGDAVIAFYPSGFNKYLTCDKSFQCAKSMINVIENGINPIFEKNDYPKLAVKIGIDEGENLAIQYGFDKSAPIDLIGYPMNVAAKMTSLTGPNKISVGNNVFKLLHPSIQTEFYIMHFEENDWKYIDHDNNSLYKVYTT